MESNWLSTEEAKARALAEGSEVLTNVSQEDLRDNAALMTTTTTNLHARLKVLATRKK